MAAKTTEPKHARVRALETPVDLLALREHGITTPEQLRDAANWIKLLRTVRVLAERSGVSWAALIAAAEQPGPAALTLLRGRKEAA